MFLILWRWSKAMFTIEDIRIVLNSLKYLALYGFIQGEKLRGVHTSTRKSKNHREVCTKARNVQKKLTEILSHGF